MTQTFIVNGVDVLQKIKNLEQENEKLHALLNSSPQVSAKLKKENEHLEQENKELKSLNKKICEDCEKEIKVYWNALEKIKDLCIHYKNTNDKCITNCYAHFIVTDLIQDKINKVLNHSES